MRYIYILKDKIGQVYIGSTSRNPKTRIVELKSQGNILLDYKSVKFRIIKETEDYVNEEEKYIKLAKNKYHEKCLNRSFGCLGPKGINTTKMTEARKLTMKRLWKNKNTRKLILKGIRKSHAINDRKEMSKKSHELRWMKMDKYIAINKITGKKFGPFQGYHFAKDILGLHPDTLFKCLKKGQKNKRYSFELV